ncbi:Type 1 glutamine amidotransferase-like domain-containing protein [Bacillus sp. Marseille-P3800]|uniref:Type 1 glutamine amidotransferase-like domain-containing protein n=1 Tax=Bacillus sp. Marseille-P3800 TaxID=2014782 RepID=UPI001145E9B3|nr:Type 1 glutamine amidotransferase-like domain-containing protein [Bacillus sp. Marseille-P3800]
MNIFLIGGGECFPSQLNHMVQMKNGSSILIIPFATELEKRYRWLRRLIKSLAHNGFKSVDILHQDLSLKRMKEKINQADLLYFTGGRPEELIKILNQKNLTKVIQSHHGAIIGYSAGALALCEECLITKDHVYPETKLIQGVGLIPFTVEVHYSPAIDIELTLWSKGRTIYALPNGSSLFYDGEKIEVLGKIYVFQEGKKKLECTPF